MPHQDKYQKCYLDLGINLEWPYVPHTVPRITTAITWVVLHAVKIIRRLDTYLPTATHLGIFTHFLA